MEQPRNGAETHALPPSASAPRAEAGTVARNSIFIKRIAAPGIAFPSGPHAGALASIALVGTALAWTLAALPFATAAACIAGFAPFCLIAVLIVDRLNPLHPHATFGLANSLTLVRAGSACLFAALAFEPSLLAGPNAWWALTGATFLLALDGIDGALARRQGVASPFGARFDLETDALLILALAGVAFGLGKAGPWILGLGLLRYGFVLAGWFVPSLSCPLPPSDRRRAVCALQVAVLGLILAPPLVPPLSAGLAALVFAALAASFAADVIWLMRQPRP